MNVIWRNFGMDDGMLGMMENSIIMIDYQVESFEGAF